MYRVTSPLFVPKSKKKNFILNLNVYRNADRFMLGNVKVTYTDIMQNQISTLPIMSEVEIVYVLFPKTRRLTDISNVLCIHDKFFCDALVKFGRLPDDDYRYLKDVHYRMGKVDPNNPRVEIYLLDPKTEGINDIMKVSQMVELTAEDVQQALQDYLAENGVTIDLDSAEVTLRANGTATIEVDNESDAPEPKEASKPVKRKRRTKAEMEADKAKEEEEAAATEEGDEEDQDDLFDESPASVETEPTEEPDEDDDDTALFD